LPSFLLPVDAINGCSRALGAGFFSLTIAERAANALGLHVVVLERRDHIGGNASSEIDPASGIEVHRYALVSLQWQGSLGIRKQVRAFSDYRHFVYMLHNGQIYPMPINLNTFCGYLGCAFTPAEAKALLAD
jgi:UDP-galactopyranose mutase